VTFLFIRNETWLLRYDSTEDILLFIGIAFGTNAPLDGRVPYLVVAAIDVVGLTPTVVVKRHWEVLV